MRESKLISVIFILETAHDNKVKEMKDYIDVLNMIRKYSKMIFSE